MENSIIQRYDYLVSQIKSECYITQAYTPNPDVNRPKVVVATGLWDTGATCSSISKKIVEALGLKPITEKKSYHAGGYSLTKIYLINLNVVGCKGVSYLEVAEADLHEIDVIIGMDYISYGDFSISNYNGKTTFKFTIPANKENVIEDTL